MNLKPAYAYLAVGVALILGWFYWYEYRPEQIRKECAALVLEIYPNAYGNYRRIRTIQNVCEDAGGAFEFRDAKAREARAVVAYPENEAFPEDAEALEQAFPAKGKVE